MFRQVVSKNFWTFREVFTPSAAVSRRSTDIKAIETECNSIMSTCVL